MLVDTLQKQEERDAHGRFLKGVPGNSKGSFRKGHSGNPAGRPPGTRNKAADSAELLLEGEAEALTRKAVELALALHGTADLGPTMAAITTAATEGRHHARRGGGAGPPG